MATLAEINNTLIENNQIQKQSDQKLDALAQMWADYTFDYRRRMNDQDLAQLEADREQSTTRSSGAVRGAVERVSGAAGRGMSMFSGLLDSPAALVPLAGTLLRTALKKGLVAGTLVAFADEAAEAITDYFGTPEYKSQVEAGLVAGGFASLIGKRFGIVTGAIVAAMSDEQRAEAIQTAKEIGATFTEVATALNLPSIKEIGDGINRGLRGLASFAQEGDFGGNFAESMLLLGAVGTALAPKAVLSGLTSLISLGGTLAGTALTGGGAAAAAAPAAAAGGVATAAVLGPAIAIAGVAAAGYFASTAFMQTELYKEWKATNDKISAELDKGLSGQGPMSLEETSISDASLSGIRPEERVSADTREQAMADYLNADATVTAMNNNAAQISGLERQIAKLEDTIAKGPTVFNWNIADEEQQLQAVQQKLAALRVQQGQLAMDRYGARTTGADIQVATQQSQANDAMGRGAPTIVNAPQTSNVSNSQPVMFSNNKPSSSHNRFTSN